MHSKTGPSNRGAGGDTRRIRRYVLSAPARRTGVVWRIEAVEEELPDRITQFIAKVALGFADAETSEDLERLEAEVVVEAWGRASAQESPPARRGRPALGRVAMLPHHSPAEALHEATGRVLRSANRAREEGGGFGEAVAPCLEEDGTRVGRSGTSTRRRTTRCQCAAFGL